MVSFSSDFFKRRLQFIALHVLTASTSIVGFYTNDFVQNSKIMKVSRKCNFSFIFVLGKKSMNNPGIHNRSEAVVDSGCFDECVFIILW